MQEWWLSMDGFMQTLWGITIFASLVFIIQSIMTFVGMDSDTNMDGIDMDTSSAGMETPFQLYTFRNFINFFLGFGWTAITLRPLTDNILLLIMPSILVGGLLVIAVMSLFRWLYSMQQSGNIDIRSAIGCKGEVYLTIPGFGEGEGKVQIHIQSSIREYNAITEGEKLRNGTPIKVTRIVNPNTLVVERS